MDLLNPAPARPSPRGGRTFLNLALALMLLTGLLPLLAAPSSSAAAAEDEYASVTLHFKDRAGETIDFAVFSAPLTNNGDTLTITVDEDQSLRFEEALSFAVYEHYATFGNRQRDITNECVFDSATGTVSIPARYYAERESLGIVFELEPVHPAYDRFVLADLNIEPLKLEREGETVLLESDIPNILTEANPFAIMPLSADFPGQQETHYQLNPYTRLETFDVDMPRKQEAYGFPIDMVGSYGFGVFFGASQHHQNGVSTGTNFNDWVLDTSASSFDPAVEAFLYESISGINGSNATFATSRTGNDFRDRYLTTGASYKDTNYSGGSAPANRAMAHATCGTAGVNNGYGAVASNPDGDNYITYKGTYSGSQSQYEGWYKFYYKIDARSAATHQAFQDVVGYLLVEPAHTGNAQVSKTSANTAISDANDNYSLSNTVFGAFADRAEAAAAVTLASQKPWGNWQAAQSWAANNAVLTFVTDPSGKSSIAKDVECGTYFVCELFAPEGFRLAQDIKTLTVNSASSENDIDTVSFADEPQRGSIDLLKQSNKPALTTNHPGYTLAGAIYGVYTDAACSQLFCEIRTSLNAQADGYARVDEVPIGDYWIREIKRPLEGYALDNQIYPISVSDETISRVNTTSVIDKAKLDPLSIFIQKKDSQSLQNHAQGAATLGDAHFRIDYYAVKKASLETVSKLSPKAHWIVRTNDKGAFCLDQGEGSFTHIDKDGNSTVLSYKVEGDEFYKLSDGRIGMPIGTYVIQEIKEPQGYLLNDTIHIRHISDEDTDEEAISTFELEQGGDLVSDRVVRADLRLTKRISGGAKLSGIPFKLTSKTTGEWHIAVSDKNGLLSTQTTPAHPHSSKTNTNDKQFLDADGNFRLPLVIDAAALDPTAGIWFGRNAQGDNVPVDDSLGALPYDTYEIEELRCQDNLLFEMIHDEIVVDETDEGQVIDIGTLNNVSPDKPFIGTTAYDGITNNLHDSEISADMNAAIVDRVTYANLEIGANYVLQGILMDKTTGTPYLVNGQEVTAEASFIPGNIEGYTNVIFEFDASDIKEQTELVVFETLLRDGIEIASHRDIEDRKQTITVSPVEIGTSARDAATGEHEGIPAEEVTIIDTVAYQGLTPGVEYTLTAILMNKDEGAPWLVDGKIASAELTFTPEKTSGIAEVEITLPGLDLDGVSLVVFESLTHNDVEIAFHADLEDEGQTVSYAYPDSPLPPTGGDEEPSENPDAPTSLEPSTTESNASSPQVHRLVQTGDEALTVICLVALLAVAGAGAAFVAYRKRR